MPAAGFTGELDVLRLMERLPSENEAAVFWDVQRAEFAEDFWRVGIGSATAEDNYTLLPPAATFAEYFGEDAATRVIVTEAEVALATFNPVLLENGEGVSFGLMLVPASSAAPMTDGAGIYIEVVQPAVLNIGTQEGGTTEVDVQRSVNSVIVRMRLERTSEGTVTVSFNGEEIGEAVQPRGSVDPSVPVLPALYMKDGGVILNVTEWTVTLQ